MVEDAEQSQLSTQIQNSGLRLEAAMTTSFLVFFIVSTPNASATVPISQSLASTLPVILNSCTTTFSSGKESTEDVGYVHKYRRLAQSNVPNHSMCWSKPLQWDRMFIRYKHSWQQALHTASKSTTPKIWLVPSWVCVHPTISAVRQSQMVDRDCAWPWWGDEER